MKALFKTLFQHYPVFTRTERLGFATLTVLVLLFFAVWKTMASWVTVPKTGAEKEHELIVAWNDFKAKNADKSQPYYAREESSNIPVTLFTFDPNTLDSMGFRRLGLSARVTKGLLNWRRKGKKFYRKEDLKPLYNLTAEDYTRIEPYISISLQNPYEKGSYPRYANNWEPLPAVIDLNKADSFTLVRLNGIGPTLAHKIVERRKALGGFLRHDQLLEVYRFSDTVFTMLKERLSIVPASISRLSLNGASMEQLKRHPYIGERTAKNILMYRDGLKGFQNIEQLRQVPLMNEEIYRKIAPYFSLN